MRRMAKRWLAAGLVLAVSAGVAFGRIPEPDTIVVGAVENAPSGRTLEVRAVVDGATLASVGVTDVKGKFVLRIPMDDGAAPRLAGTAKANDRVRLVVVDTATGAEAEILETADGGMEIPAGRGQVIQGTYRLSEGALTGGDADGDGIPDAWEAMYAAGRNGHEGLNAMGDDAAADNDGDGRTNWEEYVAGTDPLDEESVFSVRTVDFADGTMAVTAGPGATGRRYTLKRTAVLGEDARWEEVATSVAPEDGGPVEWTWIGVAGEGGYFRVDVELAK